ncbi:phage tail assembly chaperone [Brevundimonas sp.]|uniref:phage tail assembly chaperone n=1 Tax=Brevundimonas sp. TaxID=1871086 RepID=UPI003563E6B1
MTRSPLHHAAHGPPPPEGEETPWPEMMRMAAGFGAGPQAFWRLSLKEWRMLTERPDVVGPMGRGVFEQMAERWPDE